MARTEPIEIPVILTIDDAQRELEKYRQSLKEATSVDEINKQKKAFDDLTESIFKTDKAADEFNLGANFEDVYGELKPLTGRLGELEDRLYELALAGKQNTEEFKAIQQEASKFRQTIIDVDKEVDLFGENQGFARVGTSLGEVGSKLLTLDFVGAQKRAEGLQKAMDSLTADEIQKQMTALTDTFKTLGKVSGQAIVGLVKNVGMVAKAFASFGASLLLNPIFLIGAAITAIVAAIGLLLNKFGLLKPITDAVGKAFAAIGDAIDFVIQKIKDFLDWLELTDFATEESARKQADAQDKIINAHKKKAERVTDTYDQEIRIAGIAGQATFDLEREKQHAIIETSTAQIEALRVQMEALKVSGDITKEKAQEIRDAITELKLGIREAKQEIEAINATEVVAEKKKSEEVRKVRQTSYDNSKKEREQQAKNRLSAQRAIQDAEIELMREGEEREILENRIKYQRLIEDTKANEQLLAAEKLALIESFTALEFQKRNEIQLQYVDEMSEALKAANDARKVDEQLTVDASVEGMQREFEARKKYAEAAAEIRELQKNATIDTAQNILSALQANLKEGSAAAKGVAVAQATIDTYKSAQAAYSSVVGIPVIGPALAIASAAAAVASGIANVRKILAVNPSGSTSTPSASGGGGSSPNVNTNSFAMATPSPTLFGNPNQFNNVQSAQSQEQNSNKPQQITVKAVVAQDEMTASQMVAQSILNMAEL